MLKIILPFILAFPLKLIGQNSPTPPHLQISKVKVDGYDCYSTPFFELCPSFNHVQGKIIFLPDAQYIKRASTLSIFIKIDDSPTVVKLKEFIHNATKWNLSIKMIAEPESFYINKDSNVLSCFGQVWDGYEECPVLCIQFPLVSCMIESSPKYKNRYKYLKKLLKESTFKSIKIECRKENIEIPLEFPLNDTIREMEKLTTSNNLRNK